MADSKHTEKNTSMAAEAESKQQQVYNQIKEDILNNTYPPGTLMVERKLCGIYNVSRSPIRNALANLTRDGLLAFIPGKGTIVPEYTIEDILEIYDLIEVFQSYAIHSCIQKLSEVSQGAMENILSHMDDALQGSDLRRFNQWDQRFHQFIIECASNNRLNAFYHQLSCQNARFLASTLEDTELARQSLGQHREIFSCMCQMDEDKTRQALKKHYQAIKQYYINKILKRHMQ